MTNLKLNVFFAAVVTASIILHPALSQESDFFWSFHGLNQGATNSPAIGTFDVGDTASLYLYYTTDGPADSDLQVGALLDVKTSNSGVIRFTDAETLDFDVQIQGVSVGERWAGGSGQSAAFGNIGTLSDESINEWGAFTFNYYGILELHNGTDLFIDTGYDAGANAFLFGRVDFEVIGNTNGSVNIITSTGQGLAVTGSGFFPQSIDVTYGSATIEVSNSFTLGDINLDTVVDLLDVSPFTTLLNDRDFQIEADINMDGFVNLQDVGGFVDLLLNPGNPVCDVLPPPVNGNLLGDVNCDGYVNLLDGPRLAQVIQTDGICNFFNTDVNQDGGYNLLDVYALVDLILSIE